MGGRQRLFLLSKKSGKSPPATRRLFGRAVPGSYHRASPARPARPNPCPLTESLPVIGRLSGLMAEKNPPQILIDCQGVGYEVWVPMSTFYNLPALGERTTLLTHFVVREDAQLLYGFGSDTERAAFRELIKIGGIGPRMALAVLSGMSVADLAQAVSAQDGARLTKVPGIGKKTAERLLLELKGKLGADLGAPQAPAERSSTMTNTMVARSAPPSMRTVVRLHQSLFARSAQSPAVAVPALVTQMSSSETAAESSTMPT